VATTQQAESTAVATQREITTADLPKLITSSDRARATIAPFLPPGVQLERIAASLRVALAKDKAAWDAACKKDRTKSGPPPLERCAPMSVFMAIAKIAQWGLEIGETAHLVPFGTDCTPVADYKGLAELVISSGVARAVEAHCVYEKEPFRLKRGTTTEIEHHPIGDPKTRGAMVGAYALFHLRGGIILVEYMAESEINAIRQQYSKQWKNGALPEWYARKTVVRRGVKLLPKNPRLLERLADLDREVIEVPAELAALAVQEEGAPLTHRLEERTGPRPVATSGAEPYDVGAAVNNAPVPPAQHSDDAGARAEDFEEDDRVLL
jgi:phage RecT family recombinase